MPNILKFKSLEIDHLSLHLPSLLIATLLALRGYGSTSLSKSGAVAALVYGYLTLASPLRLFGVCLLGFYLAGSRATKMKAQIKATFEEPEHSPLPSTSTSSTRTVTPPGKDTAKKVQNHGGGGRRTATQVACNALVGSICSILWRCLYSGELSPSTTSWQQGDRWCVIGKYGEPDERRWSRVLTFGAVAFWSACCGDTFASELGILAQQAPILITKPFSGPVPRGTNGGITIWGLFVSLLGGVYVGALAVVCLLVQGQSESCAGMSWMVELVAVAGLSGLGGSLLDSLLGALFQPTYYSTTRKLVVHSPSSRKDDDKIIKIPGTAIFGPWLSNNGVNAVMGLVTTLIVVNYIR
ncbi:DUF92 domain-containing protein [Sporobolomyces salmoneus]|uniref:DUF92 domain-containing protein n=1 Tax=Sporobolomyces salmoneus TaxID=183962 RepID=UPI00317DBE0F